MTDMPRFFILSGLTRAKLRGIAFRGMIYGISLVFMVLLLQLIVAPLVAGLIEEWERSDAKIRAGTINESVRDQVTRMLIDSSQQDDIQLAALFGRLTADKRLLAVAVCSRSGTFRVRTEAFPPGLTCEGIEQAEEETTAFLELGGQALLISAFPLTPTELGHLVIVHDLSYAQSLAVHASFYAIVSLGLVVLVANGVAALI